MPRHGVYLVIGVNERSTATTAARSTTRSSTSADGRLLGLHRKLVPTYQERMVWGRGDSSTLTVIDTPHGRLGRLVCWEHGMPLARQAMHMKGERIHVAVWPEVSEIPQVMSRHYAFEGRCFVLAAGSFVQLNDMPDHLAGLQDLDLEGSKNHASDRRRLGRLRSRRHGYCGPGARRRDDPLREPRYPQDRRRADDPRRRPLQPAGRVQGSK
ncbi:MAG: nitrilase-related carbon-nitrogen hydrolase [Thermomicrobiales bacterium]